MRETETFSPILAPFLNCFSFFSSHSSSFVGFLVEIEPFTRVKNSQAEGEIFFPRERNFLPANLETLNSSKKSLLKLVRSVFCIHFGHICTQKRHPIANWAPSSIEF